MVVFDKVKGVRDSVQRGFGVLHEKIADVIPTTEQIQETISITREKITDEQAQEWLSSIYEKSLNGIPKVSDNIEDFSSEYQRRFFDPKIAAKELVRNQILKNAANGFVSGLGGLPLLPVTLPANITSVLYVQLRMIAAIAYLGGYNPREDAVQTMVYLSLVGTASVDIVKGTAIQIGDKIALNALKNLPGKTLTTINGKIGFRLITKFGEKGVINLWKIVPVVGGVIGGSVDAVTTQVVGSHAIKTFIDSPCIFSTEEPIELVDINTASM